MNYKLLRAVISPALKMLWPTTFYGTENLILDKNVVYVCNHYSALDTNAMVAKIFKNKFNVVIKGEAFKSKFGARFLTGMGGIPIERGEADVEAVKKILGVLKSGEPLLLFPEGTRNKSGSKEMFKFKDGAVVFALKTGSPIIPMVQYSPPKIFRRNYVLIGKPMYLEKYSGMRTSSVKCEATQDLYDEMIRLRHQLDNIVENCRGDLKKYELSTKMRLEKK